MVYGLLVGLLVAAWFSFGYTRGGSGSNKDISFYAFTTPERIAAYEEMWRREESELWSWLEERVGMDRVNLHTGVNTDQAKSIDEKLREEKVSEREIDTAIRVTEEKLNALKHMFERQKMAKRAGGSGKASKDVDLDVDADEPTPFGL
jgi:hypothetical protein